MSCIGPVANILVQIVILIAAISIIRVLIAAVFGAPLLPTWPSAVAPAGAGLGRVAGVLLAVLDIVFWAAVVISLIWFVVALLGCLGGLHIPRFG
jgi:hypothetical protein